MCVRPYDQDMHAGDGLEGESHERTVPSTFQLLAGKGRARQPKP
jgi:hypothetical protein